jgi:Mrp family chromosome partitioning ATPase
MVAEPEGNNGMALVLSPLEGAYRRLRAVPLLGRRRRGRLIVANQSNSARAESFRLLALKLQAQFPDEANRALLVMSARPDDGRSVVAANLAVALAAVAGSVIAVDASRDGRSELAQLLTDEGRAASAVDVPAAGRKPIRPTSFPGVWLTSAPWPPDDGSGLRAGAADVVDQVRSEAEWTIIDCPPCLTSSDAFFWARQIPNVVYVIRGKSHDLTPHREILAQLDDLSARVLGVVLNEG